MTRAIARCDKHVGDPFPARCYACDSLQAEYDELNLGATR